jgi:hypothetical protein
MVTEAREGLQRLTGRSGQLITHGRLSFTVCVSEFTLISPEGCITQVPAYHP